MLHYQTPTLLRHGEVWIYNFPSQRQVTIRCPRDNVWVTRTPTLSGAGLIHNASRFSITSGEMRTLPELHGVAHTNLNAPSVYVTDSSPILSRHELPRVEAALTSEVNELDQLKDRLAAAQKSLDVDTLVHIQKATPQRETLPRWHLVIAAVSCTLSPAGSWYFSPVAILVCYLMLPAHRQAHGKCCTHSSRPCFRESSSHSLCGTTLRQRYVRRIRTAL